MSNGLLSSMPHDADRSSSSGDGWAAAIRRGDADAFKHVFDAYYDELCRFALGYVDRHQAAEDVVQGVFIDLWERRCDLKVRGTLKAYLYGAVRNRAITHLRRRCPEGEELTYDVQAAPGGPDRGLREKELDVLSRACLNRLPERRRFIFILSRRHGLTYAEIAAMLGISVKTVETQMGRALAFLREQLMPYLSIFLFM